MRRDGRQEREGALQVCAHLDGLPGEGRALLAANDGRELFGSLVWYRTVTAHALRRGEAARFALWTGADGARAVFPLLQTATSGLASLTTPYTCLYAPVLSPGLARDAAVAAGRALAGVCRGHPVVRLDAVAPEWPGWAALVEGLGAAGRAVRRFVHFGNWHESVAGLSWAGYLAGRPGALRETVRRKLRRAERDPLVRAEIVTGGEGLATAIAAFESVYARSWKEPEPFPAFNAALMRALAPLGTLRLGVLWREAQPIAAQLWVVEGRRATVLKLAHDEAFKPLSPGTVLTATVLRRLLDQERVEEIDFGRGDDPYKSDWARARRPRVGMLLIDPWHPLGAAALAREALGTGRRVARAWFRGRG